MIDHLFVSELFTNTIQGEGIYLGMPATFLRLKYCSLDCNYCDTKEIYQNGREYLFEELYDQMQIKGIINNLKEGQHLVITGGSPLLQSIGLLNFISFFIKKSGFKPFIEIENECVLNPSDSMELHVDCWNNSPKLSLSGNDKFIRYRPNIIKRLSQFKNSWFKFVISSESDWSEIELDFLNNKLIDKKQIILMPLGSNRTELLDNREITLSLAIKNNVRYSPREHIMIWNDLKGV